MKLRAMRFNHEGVTLKTAAHSTLLAAGKIAAPQLLAVASEALEFDDKFL